MRTVAIANRENFADRDTHIRLKRVDVGSRTHEAERGRFGDKAVFGPADDDGIIVGLVMSASSCLRPDVLVHVDNCAASGAIATAVP